MDYLSSLLTGSGSLPGLMLLGFLLGMLHATDADHLLTVSSLSGSGQSRWQALWTASSWAVGHGCSLLLLGTVVLLLQWQLPPALPHLAELAVAALLCLLGAALLYRVLWRPLPPMMNLLPKQDDDAAPASALHQPRSFLIGCLHGTAGSAAVLAILPVLQVASAGPALAYLLLFSTGVLLAMLICGGLFAGLLGLARERSESLFKGLLCCLGGAAVGCGGLVFSSNL